MARSIITLTTDFGAADTFVGAMKGVILGINPDAVVVDLTHEVPPQDVRAGAYLLDAACNDFPPGTVHVAVVDPGVGTKRLPVVVRSPEAAFVGPDNGVLSYVLGRAGGPRPDAAPFVLAQVRLPAGWTAYHLSDKRYWRERVSNTFHGRDVFAPVAAHLSNGVAPSAMGRAIEEVTAFAVPTPVERDGRLEGCVLHVDRFGNLVTNIDASVVRERADVVVEAGGQHVRGLATSYASDASVVALAGSNGWLEVAVPNGSAATHLGLGVGDPVVVRYRPGKAT